MLYPMRSPETELGRLRVWAGNLGAHRLGRSSLDHRLRQATHMQQTTIDLLHDLRRSLLQSISIVSNERLPYDEQCSDSDSSSSSAESDEIDSRTELEVLLHGIRHVITCLYRLALTLRNPAPIDRLQKAKDVDTSHFKPWDTNHIRQKFPILESSSPFLLERLAKANVTRRQIFKYNERHNKKLRHGLDVLPAVTEPLAEVIQRETQIEREINRSMGFEAKEEGVRSDPSNYASTANTETTVATFVEDRIPSLGTDDDEAFSETSSVASEGPIDDGSMRLPEPPLGALDGDQDHEEQGEIDSKEGQAGGAESEASGGERMQVSGDSDVMSEISEVARKDIFDHEISAEEDNSSGHSIESAQNDAPIHNPIEHAQAPNFWNQAYQSASQAPEWKPYENFLLQSLGDIPATKFAAMGVSQKADALSVLILRKAKTIDDPYWKKKVNRDIESTRTVDAILHIKAELSSRGNTQRDDVFAWAGVLMLVPLMLNPLIDSAGNEDIFDEAGIAEAVDYLSGLIRRLTAIQKVYAEAYVVSTLAFMVGEAEFKSSFNYSMTQLCTQLMIWEARAITQLLIDRLPWDESPLPRLIAGLKESDDACREVFHRIGSDRIKAELKQQRLHTDGLLRLQKSTWRDQEKATDETKNKANRGSSLEESPSLDAFLHNLHTGVYETTKALIPHYVLGTCKWFLEEPKCRKWLEGSSSTVLWFHAPPGYGKSVLVKYLADNKLQRASVTKCYYFFRDDQAHTRSVVNALSALLHQLCSQNRELIRKAKDYLQLDPLKASTLSIEKLWAALQYLSRCPEAGRIVCLLDALDECEESGRKELITQLNELHGDVEARSQLSFLVTSRWSSNIENEFSQHIPRFGGTDILSMNLDFDSVMRDYSLRTMKEDLSAFISKFARKQIPNHLWLCLYLAAIDVVRSEDPKALSRLAETFPHDVYRAYERLLELSPQSAYVETLLHIVVAAQRPLSLREMNMAMSIREGHRSRKEVQLHSQDNFADYISKLYGPVVRVCDGYVYVLHRTVREWWRGRHSFSLSPLQSRFDQPDRVFARICLTYISFEEFTNNPPTKDGIEDGSLESSNAAYKQRQQHMAEYAQDHDLLSYAALYWPMHYNSVSYPKSELIGLWNIACQPQSDHFYTWFRVYWYGHGMTNDLSELWCQIPTYSALGLAAFFGDLRTAKSMLQNDESVEVKGGKTLPPLLVAISRNDSAMAGFLIKAEDSVISQSFDKWTPLGLAAARGMEFIVNALISQGVDVQHKTFPVGITALEMAARFGHVKIAQILLDSGAEVNTSNNKGQTVLMLAVRFGHESMAMLLIGAGAKVGFCDHSGMTALHYAVAGRHENLTQVLLDNGAEVDSKDENGQTALSWAAREGFHSIIWDLANRTSDIDSKDDEGLAPLHYAIRGGHDTAVKELLKSGADVNILNDTGLSALSYAIVQRRSPGIVQTLLNANADPNIVDEDGRSPVMYEILGHSPMRSPDNILAMYAKGAALNLTDKHGRTALSFAAENDNGQIVRALLEANADPNIVDEDGKAPLHYVAATSHLTIIPLFNAKADMHLRDSAGNTPLDIARQNKNDNSIELIENILSRE
ncbi:hypothetical protein ACLMJK_002478 [Lecanora helva]